MKRIAILSIFAVMAVSPVFAGGGYYEVVTHDCSPSGMQRALDQATLDGRAVTTVVKCGSARQTSIRKSSVRVARPQYVQYAQRPVVIDCLPCCDFGC